MSEGHKHPRYILVFVWLTVMTLLEVVLAKYGFAMDTDAWWWTTVILLVVLALAKAALVGLYFMHLISERVTFIFIVCFPLFLAVVLVCSLIPDVVLG